MNISTVDGSAVILQIKIVTCMLMHRKSFDWFASKAMESAHGAPNGSLGDFPRMIKTAPLWVAVFVACVTVSARECF
jgi:hypothetical protein